MSDIATALTGSVSSDGQTTISGQLKFPNGTANLPSHTFANDLTTGMYYVGTQKLGFAAGGLNALTVDMTQLGTGQSGSILQYPSGVVLQPIGTIHDFAGSTAPTGWFLCAGQVVAQASYPELFTVIGSTYNTGGEGAGNYRLPDCRGRATYGKDNMGGSAANRITVAGGNFDGTSLGGSGGAQNHTLTAPEIPSHTHAQQGTFTSGVASQDHTHLMGAGAVAVAVGAGGGAALNTGGANTATAGQSQNHTHNVTISGNTDGGTGGGGAHTVLNPAIIFNKIIFSGRP